MPAASVPATENVYVVEALSPTTVKCGPVAVPSGSPFLYTAYPGTSHPEITVETLQLSTVPVLVVAAAVRSVGTSGTFVQLVSAFVVIAASALSGDTPAESFAVTVKVYCVAGERCRTSNVVVETTAIETPS